MTKQLAPIRALLLFALTWGFLLVLLSFFIPVVTVMSSHDGLQPRVSAVQACGLAGVLPAMRILVAVVLTASLLAFGRHAPSRASLTSAEGIAGLVLMVGLLAPLVFHIPGSVHAPSGHCRRDRRRDLGGTAPVCLVGWMGEGLRLGG